MCSSKRLGRRYIDGRVAIEAAHRQRGRKTDSNEAAYDQASVIGRGARVRAGAYPGRPYQLWSHLPGQWGAEEADPGQHQTADAGRGSGTRRQISRQR